MARVVVLYDRDYLKKFRVYFDEPKQRIKFEHDMRNFYQDPDVGGRQHVTPDFVTLTTIAPADLENPTGLAAVALDGYASSQEGAGIKGYDEKYLWLVNTNERIPLEGGAPLVAEVLCRWFHSHDRLGDGINNDDESLERPLSEPKLRA